MLWRQHQFSPVTQSEKRLCHHHGNAESSFGIIQSEWGDLPSGLGLSNHNGLIYHQVWYYSITMGWFAIKSCISQLDRVDTPSSQEFWMFQEATRAVGATVSVGTMQSDLLKSWYTKVLILHKNMTKWCIGHRKHFYC